MSFRVFACVLGLASILWGCGGGGGSVGSPFLVTNPSFQITWPQRSRQPLQAGLTSALSVSITIQETGGRSIGPLNIDRDPTKTGGYTGTYTISQQVSLTALQSLTATFYDQAGEQGQIVGTATATPSLTGTTLDFSHIVLTGTIAKVVAVAPSTITMGSGAVQLGFTATDASGNVVAVSAGSANWAISSGRTILGLTLDGKATPLEPGTAKVNVVVDGFPGPATIVVKSNTAPDSNWSKFRGNSLNTGRLGGSGATSSVKWTASLGSTSWSSPAIAADGTIYVGSADHNVYAFNSDSTKKWSFLTGDVVMSSPAVGSDGTIYVGSEDGSFHALNPDGTKKWAYRTGGGIQSSAAIGADGTIYVGSYDNKLYAFNPDGSVKWTYLTTGNVFPSPAIGTDGTIYLGSGGGPDLYAFNPDGSVKWTFNGAPFDFQTSAIGSDGTIYAAADDGNLYAIDSAGNLKWFCQISSMLPGFVTSSPAVGADGTLYVGTLYGQIVAVNPGGTIKWSIQTPGAYTQSCPAIGSDGTIYIGSEGDGFYALNPDGSTKWKLAENGNASSPAIGPDGTLYFTSADGNLYAVH